jgi:hypothetical protein
MLKSIFIAGFNLNNIPAAAPAPILVADFRSYVPLGTFEAPLNETSPLN